MDGLNPVSVRPAWQLWLRNEVKSVTNRVINKVPQSNFKGFEATHHVIYDLLRNNDNSFPSEMKKKLRMEQKIVYSTYSIHMLFEMH